MNQELLPIGSVVELKEAKVPVMIAGYLASLQDREGKVWDYSGFVYPIGFDSKDEILSFDRDQVENVIAYGYVDQEEMAYVSQVEEMKKEIEKQPDGKEE